MAPRPKAPRKVKPRSTMPRARYNWVSILLWVGGGLILLWAAFYWYYYGQALAYQAQVSSLLEGFVVPIAGISLAASVLAEAVWLTAVGIAMIVVGWFLNRRFPGGNWRARPARR